MGERKLFSKGDALRLGLPVLLAALLFLLLSLFPKGSRAVVERNGEVLAVRDLSRLTEAEELSVEGEGGVMLTVTFYPDGAAVTSSTCPDAVCVRTGKLTRTGESSLCLPAGVSLRIEGGPGVDGMTF